MIGPGTGYANPCPAGHVLEPEARDLPEDRALLRPDALLAFLSCFARLALAAASSAARLAAARSAARLAAARRAAASALALAIRAAIRRSTDAASLVSWA